MSDRIVDVGAGTDPDPRATETADLFDIEGIDHVFDIREPWPFQTESVDGLILSHVLEHVDDQAAVLAEVARVLRGGGWCEITVPVGADAWADPDHERAWTWATPQIIDCRARQRHWDADVPLALIDRSTDVWLFSPLKWASPLLQAAARVWPAEAVRRCSSGEITATFRRVGP